VTDRRQKENVLDGKKTSQGAIAQLGERLPCTQEVGGSIPPGSTIYPGDYLLLQKTPKERSYFFFCCLLFFNNLEISDVLSGST
jgi:hypothetical protein